MTIINTDNENEYFKNTDVRATFTLDPAADPAILSFKVKDPGGVITTPSGIRSGIGIYYMDIYADKAGEWYYRLESTTPTAAAEASFMVKISQFS